MNIYLAAVILILLVDYLLHLMADGLNMRRCGTGLPGEFEGYYSVERYTKAQAYLRERTRFSLTAGGFFTLVTIGFIPSGGFNMVDLWARGFGMGEMPTGLIFAAILFTAYLILRMPFSAYRTFVIEERYGFNRTTIATFAADIFKSYILSLIIGGAAFAGVVWFFTRAGEGAWLYSWIGLTVFQLFLLFIAPVVIMPLFNKFIPLEEGELKSSIESYARSQEFGLAGIFKIDGSRRSAKSNAFFTGFGRFRRIALFDTLIEKHTVDELVSVLAHEIGHYKKRHILKNILLSTATSGLMLYMLSLFIKNPRLFEAFRMEHLSVYAGLIFFGFLFTPVNMAASVIGNVLSRRHEYAADAYAVSTYGKPESMISALKKLSADNLANLTPHPFKVFLHYSHPPVLERIEAIRRDRP